MGRLKLSLKRGTRSCLHRAILNSEDSNANPNAGIGGAFRKSVAAGSVKERRLARPRGSNCWSKQLWRFRETKSDNLRCKCRSTDISRNSLLSESKDWLKLGESWIFTA